MTNLMDRTIDMLMSFKAIDYSLMARIVAIGELGASLPAGRPPFNPGHEDVTLDRAWVDAHGFTEDRLRNNVRTPPP